MEKRYRSVVGAGFRFKLSNRERMCVRILAARCARALRRLPPSITTRGRRESRVRAAPAVSRAIVHKERTRAYRFSGGNPAFPARWFTAYSALSPVTGFLATVIPEKLVSQELDTSVGVSGPHGFTVRHGSIRHSPPSRPPHPTARS